MYAKSQPTRGSTTQIIVFWQKCMMIDPTCPCVTKTPFLKIMEDNYETKTQWNCTFMNVCMQIIDWHAVQPKVVASSWHHGKILL